MLLRRAASFGWELLDTTDFFVLYMYVCISFLVRLVAYFLLFSFIVSIDSLTEKILLPFVVFV